MSSNGSRLGRYDLVRLIGSGGMGEVWEAVLVGPHGFRKRVALKLLPLSMQGPHLTGALISEARLGALASHPNVVSILELGQVSGRWFVAMELVTGCTVEQLTRQAPLPVAHALDIAAQVCSGLAHLHGLAVEGHSAIVHRDLKPSNLLVDLSGLVRIADLGIARLTGQQAGVAGTPGYMAPEQLDGREGPPADLFTLGAVLYEMVTGQPALGRQMEGLRNTMRLPALLKSERFTRLDERLAGLREVVVCAMAPEPDQRYPHAAAMGRALSALRARCSPPEQALGEQVSSWLRQQQPAPAPAAQGEPEPTQQTWAPTAPPTPRDRFVGRARELAAVAQALEGGARLVVLTGPGGAGKTRLLHHVAAELSAQIPHVSVDLSEVSSPEELCRAVAWALDLPLPAEDNGKDWLSRALRARGQLLLLLDDVSAVAEAARELIGRWLSSAGQLAVLATSRVSLQAHGERTFAVGPLEEADAVALFLERAPRELQPDEQEQLAVLVDALDRLPLAIELAAARARVLSVPGILERLQDRFRLLAGGPGDRPVRQRSLLASLEGSWELLSPPERAALSQLSVFSGGFTLPAAEATVEGAPEAPWTLDLVSQLVDHGLIAVEPDQRDRMRLLVSVREYAASKLSEEERLAAELRHGRWFAQLDSEGSRAVLAGPGRVRRLEELAGELDNLVVACRRALARQDGPVARATALVAAEVWIARGPLGAASELLRCVLALPSAEQDARLHGTLGWLGVYTSDPETARHLQRAIELASGQGDVTTEVAARCSLTRVLREQPGGAEAELLLRDLLPQVRQSAPAEEDRLLQTLGALSLERGELREAEALFGQAWALCLRYGDRSGAALVLSNLGMTAFQAGHLELARTRLTDAQQGYRELGDERSAMHLQGTLGLIELRDKRYARARELFLEGLEYSRRSGEVRSEGLALMNLGMVDHAEGRLADARARLEATVATATGYQFRSMQSMALHNIAVLHEAEGDLPAALEACEQALTLQRSSPSGGLVRTLCTSARLLRASGALVESAHRAFEARDLAASAGALRHQAIAEFELARVRRAERDWPRAREHLDTAASLSASLQDPEATTALAGERALLLAARGELAPALRELEPVEAELTRTGNLVDLSRVWLVRAEILLLAGRRTEATAELDRVEGLLAQAGAGKDTEPARNLARLRRS
jgi:predicted ATPase/tetratricopeptide (TPR) repeat protein